MEGGYLKQLRETVYRLTKRVEVRVSKGTKQRHNQNNDIGVAWQTNSYIRTQWFAECEVSMPEEK